MSNKLITNSRFAVLVEETNGNNVFKKKEKKEEPIIDRGNSFKNNNNYTRRDNSNRDFESTKNKEKREAYKKEQEIQIIKKKEEEKTRLLSIENFPVLLEKTNSDKKIATCHNHLQEGFIDKVKFVKPIIDSNKNNNENYIKPGWVEIKYDKKTRQIVTTNSNETINKDISVEEKQNEMNVLRMLTFLHEKRTKEYIDLWGYDMWENMFCFPNYDYDYFNKLDEKYYEEMQSDDDTDDDDDSN